MATNRFKLTALYAALVSKVNEIIEKAHLEGISSSLEYHAWDSRQDVNELPDKDLIGIVDWTFSEEDHLPEIELGILLSVYRDKNLFREVEILDLIRDVCVHETRPEYKTWAVRDESNKPFASLQVTDFSIMPAGESEARTVRTVGITLKRSDYSK